MKKIGKVLVLYAIILTVVLSISTMPVYAAGQGGMPNINAFSPTNEEMPTEFANVISLIITVIQVIGIAVAVIMLMVLGIKYMTGSVEQKANYKKTMVPYIVGAVLVVSISTIVKLIYGLASQI